MRKPEFQWEGAGHRARRRPGPASELAPELADDPRAELFDIELPGGRRGVLACGLRRQVVDLVAAEVGAELTVAVTAWLIARGARSIDLRTIDGRAVAAGPVGPADLSSPVPDAAPRRLVSIAPSNAEVIASLGRFDRVVAVEDSTDWPASVTALERLGPDLAPDLDRIAELAPDLVVASLTVPGMERNVVGLRARGVPALVLAPRSVDDVLEEVRRAGAHLHAVEAADQVVAGMASERDALRARAQSRPVRRVYLEWWPRPMFTPGAACYSNELIALAGGRNVFDGRAASSVEIDTAELVAAAPEICFVSWCGVAEDKLDPRRLIERPGLEALDAAARGRVFKLDERFAGRPGPRMLEAARRMADAIETLT